MIMDACNPVRWVEEGDHGCNAIQSDARRGEERRTEDEGAALADFVYKGRRCPRESLLPALFHLLESA
jgi:hypothetical protein